MTKEKTFEVGDLVALSSTVSSYMKPGTDAKAIDSIFFVTEKLKTASVYMYYVVNPLSGRIGPLQQHELLSAAEIKSHA